MRVQAYLVLVREGLVVLRPRRAVELEVVLLLVEGPRRVADEPAHHDLRRRGVFQKYVGASSSASRVVPFWRSQVPMDCLYTSSTQNRVHFLLKDLCLYFRPPPVALGKDLDHRPRLAPAMDRPHLVLPGLAVVVVPEVHHALAHSDLP